MEDINEMTPEDIATTYKNALRSVSLVHEIVATGDTDEESVEALARNRTFLKSLLEADYWTTEDLTPIRDAVNG